jgi:hypothetical protein
MLNYTVSQINSPTTFNTKDITILEGVNVGGKFIPYEDKVKVVVTDIYGRIYSIDNNYTLFTLENDTTTSTSTEYSQIKVDFDTTLTFFNLFEGEYVIYFSFNRPLFQTTPDNVLFISEISSDRTELRLDSTLLDNLEVLRAIRFYQESIQNSNEIKPFYLEFSTGVSVSGVNLLLTEQNELLIKLYQPLPLPIETKDTCFLYEEVGQQVAYRVFFTPQDTTVVENIPYLRGPNFNLGIKDEYTAGFEYQNLNTLLLTYSSSSLNQIRSVLEEKDIEINVDYADFTDFIHYSSARQRLLNFYYKVSTIESYQNDLNLLSSITGSTSASLSVSQSRQLLVSNINNYIDKFDGFEYYMYFETGSYAWPKANSQPPYTLYSTASSQVQTWISSRLLSGSIFDDNNKDNLINTIPNYILEDANNNNYILFINMIGQLFDINWLYTKGITDKLSTDNRPEFGAPKKLMKDILNSVGIRVYDNQFSNQDLFTSLIGVTPTGQLNYPTGSEKINVFITASKAFTLENYQTEVYKRIYHNLPYLLKKKGTVQGLKTLINLFGIPDTILRINEYGGKDKDHSNDWDYWYNQYNYSYKQEGNNFISSSWSLNSNWGSPSNVPSSIAFRFKTNGLPTSNIPRSQSLWSISGSSGTATITLTYTGSGYVSASYSGSTVNPYYQYARLDFIPNTAFLTTSASVYLPFFDGDWWSVMLTKNNTTYTLYSKNSIYNGYDGDQLGFQASSSVIGSITAWNMGMTSYFGSASISNYTNFSGSFQEIRYYTVPISESVFDDYVMNPNSIEGNGINQGPNQLAFRASLGGELYTGSTSIHPKVTGSWATTSSFAGNSNFFYSGSPVFIPNTQSIFFDQPPVGIKNPVADKIKLQDITLPYSSSLANIPDNIVLSPFRTIQQNYVISSSYTKDINYIEVAFSPQNEINDDISSQIGFINIGEYIGDPRLVSSSAQSYPDLDILRNEYFQKYVQNYNYNDYIRLIKYFDNSLFKLIQDFTPARSGLSTGIVIKQHLLERNKYATPQLNTRTPVAVQGSGSSNITWNTPFTLQNILVSGSSIQMYIITGSNAGSFPNLNGQTSSVLLPSNYNFSVTQRWSGTNIGPSGSVPFTQSSQIEFYNGELSGSRLLVTDGDLNGGNPFLNANTTALAYTASYYFETFTTSSTPNPLVFDGIPLNNFLNINTSPNNGEIYLWVDFIG